MAITSIPRSSSSTSPQPHFSSTSSSSTSTIIGSKHNNNISTTTNNTNNTNSTTTSSSTIIPTILCMNFNQDQGCFAISHEQGFLVYNTNPIELRVKRNFTCTPTNTTTTTTINNNNNNNNDNNNNHNNNNRNNSTGSNESSSSTGFYNTTHNQKNFKAGSGISHITMLHRTNYLALVGGGEKPRFPPNKLIIWDDLKRKTSLLLEFNSPVLNVLLSRVRIIVVLIDQIIVYGFAAPPKKFHTYNTINNEFGIADLSINSNSSNNTNFNSTTFTSTSTSSTTTSPSTNNSINETTRRSISPPNSSGSSSNSLKETNSINNNNNNNNPSSSNSTSSSSSYQTLAFPGRSVGQIQIVDVGNNNEKNSMNIIKAHKLNIRCLCLNKSGTLVASASITGTLIRIHSTRTTTLLYEFRRGIDKAVITSMKFNHDDSKLAVLSDKHTLHVYNIDDLHNSNTGGTSGGSGTNGGGFMNRHSFLNNLPYVPNYFNSTWSFCSVNTNKYHEQNVNNNSSTHNNKSSQIDEGTIGWSGDDSIIIIWKLKKIWEKYVIVETENHNYELIRSSWKKLES